ncbi:MAG: isocitrate lyase/PEP mutase family protein [Ferrovibrionaceae bacterium]
MRSRSLAEDQARQFLRLHHQARGFVLPNAWDAASAIILADAGFAALATTSAGIAFSLGLQDYHVEDPALGVGRDRMFRRLAEIVEASPVPVSADLEAGFGDAPEMVATTIDRAIDTGLAGGNIEDKVPGEDRLYDEELAVERIAAAAAAARGRGRTFVLNARTDVLLLGGDIGAAVRRANRFLQAGADCIFVPGAADLASIRRLADEIDGPLNVVVGLGPAPSDIPAILDAGVSRVTVGGTIARSVMGFIRDCARMLREQSSIGFAADQISGADLNALFARHRHPTAVR